MSPEDMEKHIINNFERILTTTVNDVEHTESQSLYGDRDGEDLLPAECEDRDRDRPGDRHLPDGHPRHAPGHDSPRW